MTDQPDHEKVRTIIGEAQPDKAAIRAAKAILTGKVPYHATQEGFTENCARIIASEYKGPMARLIAAGKEVISCWETGDLAAAVRELDDAIKEVEQ